MASFSITRENFDFDPVYNAADAALGGKTPSNKVETLLATMQAKRTLCE